MNDYVNELKDLVSDFDNLKGKIAHIYTHSFENDLYKNCTTLGHCDRHLFLMRELVLNLLIDIEKKES